MISWVREVYRLSAEGEDDKALDVIFDNMDELMYQQAWDKIDDILSELDVTSISTTVGIGYFSITHCVKQYLSQREGFGRRFQVYLYSKESPDRVERLLKNLM